LIESVQFAGTLAALVVLYLVQSMLFLLLRPLRGEHEDKHAAPGRQLADIVRQPVFIVAVLGGTTAYGVMTLIMTATPLSMHINDGYSVEQTAHVIRTHVLAMYMPSLFTGFLIERLGIGRLMTSGAVTLLVACIIGLQGQSVMHYTFALVLLGIGWNFLYVGGTSMLTLSYSMSERFKAQAVNEFSVFGTSATASLLAGTVMYVYGWSTLIVLPLPLLILILGGLYIVRRDARVRRLSPAGR
jgi:MFS family permease